MNNGSDGQISPTLETARLWKQKNKSGQIFLTSTLLSIRNHQFGQLPATETL
jgi:hypothetical protein